MARETEEFTFYIGWCASQLATHGSAQQPGKVAVQVFVRALHSASSASQWAVFRPVLQASCPGEMWAEMVESYHVDVPVGDDKLVEEEKSTPTPPPAAATVTPAVAVAPKDPPMGNLFLEFDVLHL